MELKSYLYTQEVKHFVDAVSECMRFWVANCDTTAHMAVGSTVGPSIFVRICGWSTSQISRELKSQILDEFGLMPKKLNCTIVLVVAHQVWFLERIYGL